VAGASGQQIIARIGTRMETEKGALIHLEAKPDQVHLLSTSTEVRITA
jgi:multiple sugar transport system ATP-binding protein